MVGWLTDVEISVPATVVDGGFGNGRGLSRFGLNLLTSCLKNGRFDFNIKSSSIGRGRPIVFTIPPVSFEAVANVFVIPFSKR